MAEWLHLGHHARRFIKRSQSLGFSLDDVQALLSLDDGQACTAARTIGEHKLAEVRQRIQTLQALEAALKQSGPSVLFIEA